MSFQHVSSPRRHTDVLLVRFCYLRGRRWVLHHRPHRCCPCHRDRLRGSCLEVVHFPPLGSSGVIRGTIRGSEPACGPGMVLVAGFLPSHRLGSSVLVGIGIPPGNVTSLDHLGLAPADSSSVAGASVRFARALPLFVVDGRLRLGADQREVFLLVSRG